MKNIDIVSLFPEIIDSYINNSPITKSLDDKDLLISTHQLRNFSLDKHNKVDDKQYGGDPGMVLMAEPLIKSIDHISELRGSKPLTILMSPQGKKIDPKLLVEILESNFIAIICGRYEGVDERFIEEKVDIEISIGDFIVSGGELPSLILLESLLRFLPGIIGNEISLDNDSFGINFQNLLKGPVYTRPKIINGREVPEILLSGDPKKISKWRENISKKRTQERRKDL